MSENNRDITSGVVKGLAIGGGLGAGALLGYYLYKKLKWSPMAEYIEKEYREATSDLNDLLEKIKKGVPITDKEVNTEWAKYKPKLDAMNEDIENEGGRGIELPDNFDELTNEEKATTLKIYYMQANRRKATLVEPTGQLMNTLTRILYLFGACAAAAIFIRLVDIPGLIRKIRPPPSPRTRTKIINIKRSDGTFIKNVKVIIDDTPYVVSDGVLSLDLIVGQKYVIRIIKEGFKELRRVIRIPSGTSPLTNEFTPEPIAHPDADPEDEPIPDMEPDRVVDLTPDPILVLIASWLGTSVEWMKNHPLETATIISLTIALVLTIISPIPGDEYAVGTTLSSYLSRIGIKIGVDKLLSRIPLAALRAWIGV